jgi:hypothetical protein
MGRGEVRRKLGGLYPLMTKNIVKLFLVVGEKMEGIELTLLCSGNNRCDAVVNKQTALKNKFYFIFS